MGLDLTFITDGYFWDFEDPDVINTGWCYVWAWLARLAFPAAKLLVYDDPGRHDGHAFIELHGLYYDSSKPTGCKTVEELKFFEEYSITNAGPHVRFLSDDRFKMFWNGCGKPAFETQGLEPWPEIMPEFTRPKRRKR